MTGTSSILRLTLAVMLLNLPCPSGLRADSVVRVHMIDARTGKHIPKKPVRMWVIDAPDQWRPGYLEEKTDSNGVAVFHISGTTPSLFRIRIGMGGWWEECSPNDRAGYSAEEILVSGMSKEGFCGKLPNIAEQFHPTPGDIYIFAVHDTFGERLKRPVD